MIDGWDIYWVMQADSIKLFLVVTGAISAFAIITTIFLYTIDIAAGEGRECFEESDRRSKQAIHKLKRWLILPVLLLLLGALTPSTKTAATMIVLPAIANNETIQAEAQDLYELAKSALSELAGVETKADQD